MTSPFKTPVYISDDVYLCAEDCGLVAELVSATPAEIAEIVKRINAYDELVDALGAIRARFDGVFDHPALVKRGPLTSTAQDMWRFANDALESLK